MLTSALPFAQLQSARSNSKLPAVKYHLIFARENSAELFHKFIIKLAHPFG